MARLKKDNCCCTFFKILFASRDIFDDARNTFLKDAEDTPQEKETQINELNKGQASFSWSDEEFGTLEQIEKEKYRKSKRKGSNERQQAS